MEFTTRCLGPVVGKGWTSRDASWSPVKPEMDGSVPEERGLCGSGRAPAGTCCPIGFRRNNPHRSLGNSELSDREVNQQGSLPSSQPVPGERELLDMTLDTARKRWFAQGTTSFVLFGTGICVIFDAAFRRMSEAHWEIWVVEGTVGLILMMAGLAFFGSAVRYLVHMDRINEYVDRKARSRARRERNQTELQMCNDQDIRLKPVRMGVQ